MSASASRAVLIQLARLGDLLQSLPAIRALKAGGTDSLDLLCPAPFTPLASRFPGIDRVLSWDGLQWGAWAERWAQAPEKVAQEALAYLHGLAKESYAVAYNLNQHPRAVLAAHWLADRVVGVGEGGPLQEDLPPWAAYLRKVALDRSGNRVHLADAFCGLCRVRPTGEAPVVAARDAHVPQNLTAVGQDGNVWVALVVGAGDPERCIPPPVWASWITILLERDARARIVLVGGPAERERANWIQDEVPQWVHNRLWDAVGRTDVCQLAGLLSRCRWVIGGDTGPLHLGAATGASAIGLYFANARVHETGPYGEGHWVWQAEAPATRKQLGGSGRKRGVRSPDTWPVRESVELLLTGTSRPVDGWSLWRSRLDRLGVSFALASGPSTQDRSREEIWARLGPMPCLR